MFHAFALSSVILGFANCIIINNFVFSRKAPIQSIFVKVIKNNNLIIIKISAYKFNWRKSQLLMNGKELYNFIVCILRVK